jgi:hypothetical protein
MTLRQLMGCSVAAVVGAGAILAPVAAAQATMLSAPHYTTPYVQHIDCAVGAHIGPLGGCILGRDDNPPPVVIERRVDDSPPPVVIERRVDENPAPVVIERRAADAPDSRDADGCASKSITRTDGSGNTETKTKTNC